MIRLTNEVPGRMDKRERVEVSYVDFQETSHSVNHKLLHQKVKAYRVDAQVRNWIAQGLTGRSSRMRFRGVSKAWDCCTARCPMDLF